MEAILSKLTNELKDEELKISTEEIVEYYKINSRHSYAVVSTFVYKLKDDDIDYLLINLTKIRLNLNEEVPKVAVKLFKLIDHIQLESRREKHIKDDYFKQMTSMISVKAARDFIKIKDMQKEIKEDMQKEYKNEKEEMQKEFEKQTNEIDKINSNLISVLGIFGAIIVAFFGGLNLLGSVLDNMNQVSMYRLAFMSIVCLSGLFNVIFMLLHCISKLTGKKLWSNCKISTSCSMCSSQNNRIICLYEKYPLVIIYNVISVWGLITLFIMYIVDKYNCITNILELINWSTKNGIVTLASSMILMVAFECALIKSAIYLFKKYRNKCDCIKIVQENNNYNNQNEINNKEILEEAAEELAEEV
ncbi:hypothetical protein DWV13_04310 [Clostridium botulinum]|uniref:hypothetical protein n=1 Tax=Clostridium TaxID=1485 RepID=UPI0013F89685|nr:MULTISPECIES: hypothetical protein [Clostridium]MCS6130866.1 hypothetical protein [Clostridium botulinum]NFL45766.1 hypothetical protein [Clostridium botulinum]NFL89141.1 hypothetical protein [Clostridium botulinum]